jgi:uncharacterized membrane protein
MENQEDPSQINIVGERGGGGPYFQIHHTGNPMIHNLSQPQQKSMQQLFMDYFGTQNTHTSQIFSGPFGLVTWFFGLKWYVIIFIIVFGLFLFFQIESAIESKKNNRKNDQKKKKEGMKPATIERMKGILRDSDNEYKKDISKKNVSFNEDEPKLSGEEQARTDRTSESAEIDQIYNLWIRPWIYTTFRNIGVR